MSNKMKRYVYKSVKQGSEPAKQHYVIWRDLKGAGRLGTCAENSFAIILFERGKGMHTINSKNYPVKPKQIHMQFPEQKQQWKLQPGAKGQRLIIRKVLAQTFSTTLQFTFSPYNQQERIQDVCTGVYSGAGAAGSKEAIT